MRLELTLIVSKTIVIPIKLPPNSMPINGIEPMSIDFQSSALPLSYTVKVLARIGFEPMKA